MASSRRASGGARYSRADREASFDGHSIPRKPISSPTSPESQIFWSPAQPITTSRSLRPPSAALGNRPLQHQYSYTGKRSEALVSEALVSEATLRDEPKPEPTPDHSRPSPKHVTPGWKRPIELFKVTVGLLLPVPFFVLAIYVARLDGRDADDDAFSSLYTVMKLTVSIFPVVYALVVGRAVSSVATYKLERSSRLGTLERLMGSQSLGSTINTIFSLGIFHWVTPLMLILWALSPIGGQSAINLVSIEPTPIFGQRQLSYFSTEGTTLFQSGDGGFQSELNSVYAASVFAPSHIRESPTDLWGNVKIPYFSAVSEHGQADPDGWYAVGNNSLSGMQYSSLVGIPILANMTDGENTTMSMLSSYLEFDCAPLQVGDDGITVEDLRSGITFGNDTWYSYTNPNNTFLIALNGMNNVSFAPYVQYNFLKNITLDQPEQWKLLFHGGLSNSSDWGYTQCAISTVYVESSILCAGTACGVDRMRSSTARHPNPWNTDFACASTFTWFTRGFLPALGTYPSNVHAGASGPAEQYLATGSVVGGFGVAPGWYQFNGTEVSSTSDFSARMGHLINTYWHASYEPSAFHGNTSALAALDDPNTYGDPANFASTPRALRHTQAQTRQWKRVYVVSWPWLSVFLIATAAMMLAALLSALLILRTRVPRILGSVAGLLRDARHVQLPAALRDSTAHWDELAHSGRNLRLCLADIRPHADTGHIAVQVCEGERPVAAVAKERYYD